MTRYEVVREIFNQCSGNQMRDVFFEELEVSSTDAYMNQYRIGKDIQEDKYESPDGTIQYDLLIDGLRQRVTFTPAE